jgi:hypothetical protein
MLKNVGECIFAVNKKERKIPSKDSPTFTTTASSSTLKVIIPCGLTILEKY